MAIDPSISLNAKAPEVSLSDLREMIALKSAKQDYQKAKDTYSADVAQRLAESRSAQAGAELAQSTVQPRIAQQQAETSTAQTGAESAAFNLQDAKHQKTIDQIIGLVGDDAIRKGDHIGISAALDQAEQNAIQYGSSPDEVKKTIDPIRQLAQKDPHAVQPVLLRMLKQGLTAGAQANVMQPSGPQVNTGQMQYQANTNPLAAAPIGPVQGTAAMNQIPVGTQVYDKNSQAPALVGPGGGIGPQAAPSLGEAENIGGTVAVVNKDYADTQANAASAANNISILQNIKKYAHGAATGIAGKGGIASIVSDISRVTGLSEGEIKSNTDLLAKNANMLALAGGDTNLARTLAEAANPNTHMSPEAIRKASDQVMSIHEMALAKNKYIGQFKNNPALYAEKLGEFNQIADPRIFQLKNMNLKEKAEMKASMTPAEREAFKGVLQKAESIGIIQ